MRPGFSRRKPSFILGVGITTALPSDSASSRHGLWGASGFIFTRRALLNSSVDARFRHASSAPLKLGILP
jgi:hypothetical protein